MNEVEKYIEWVRPRAIRVARSVMNGSRAWDVDAAAEDVVQDVLIRVWVASNCEGIPEEWKVRQWVRQVAIHHLEAMDVRTACETSLDQAMGAGVEYSAEAESPDPRILLIAEATDSLSPVLRGTFIRHYFQGESCEEIATATGSPLGTILRRLNSARMLIKLFLNPANNSRLSAA